MLFFTKSIVKYSRVLVYVILRKMGDWAMYAVWLLLFFRLGQQDSVQLEQNITQPSAQGQTLEYEKSLDPSHFSLRDTTVKHFGFFVIVWKIQRGYADCPHRLYTNSRGSRISCGKVQKKAINNKTSAEVV